MKGKFLLMIMLMAADNAFAQCVEGRRNGNGACCRNENFCSQNDSLFQNNVSPSTLIIFYDGSKVQKRLLKAAKKIGAEVIYTYRSFNAIAIRKPDDWTLNATKEYFENMKGVLQVNYDHIYKLD